MSTNSHNKKPRGDSLGTTTVDELSQEREAGGRAWSKFAAVYRERIVRLLRERLAARDPEWAADEFIQYFMVQVVGSGLKGASGRRFWNYIARSLRRWYSRETGLHVSRRLYSPLSLEHLATKLQAELTFREGELAGDVDALSPEERALLLSLRVILDTECEDLDKFVAPSSPIGVHRKKRGSRIEWRLVAKGALSARQQQLLLALVAPDDARTTAQIHELIEISCEASKQQHAQSLTDVGETTGFEIPHSLNDATELLADLRDAAQALIEVCPHRIKRAFWSCLVECDWEFQAAVAAFRATAPSPTPTEQDLHVFHQDLIAKLEAAFRTSRPRSRMS